MTAPNNPAYAGNAPVRILPMHPEQVQPCAVLTQLPRPTRATLEADLRAVDRALTVTTQARQLPLQLAALDAAGATPNS